MALPFTAEQFSGGFSDYNTAVWPAQWFLVVFALVVYPVWAAQAGHPYPATPTFGLPCPTTIFTIGLLCFAVPPTPRIPLIVPVLWCLVGAQAAFLLGVQPDLGLIVAGMVGVALRLPLRRPTQAGTS